MVVVLLRIPIRALVRAGVTAVLLVMAAGRTAPVEAGLLCPNDCSGRGACEFEGLLNPDRKGWPWSRVCVCDPGWTSPDCSLCSASDACPGRQVCRFGECRCGNGWQGENCDRCYSSVGCGDNGACFEEKCICKPGWSGIECAVPAPTPLQDEAAADSVP